MGQAGLGADVRTTLPATVESAHQARTWARGLLPRWGVDEAAGDVLLVLSELVTNAVRHGRGEVRVRMAREPHLVRIEVADDDPTPMRGRRFRSTRTSGRGLVLVSTICAQWGVDYEPDGKTVWADVAA